MEIVYTIHNQSNLKIMITFSQQYEIAKNNSIEFMKNGQISAYLNALLEMNKYKRLMVAVVAN
jgi:hypothetical protein